MTALSPRASISGASGVAEDFEESLKDLQQNNRYEISNLTLIAKESTESAQAISKALENHIRTTAPSRKLPALYVLDSIVKNVGTPYTVYLGRNLYTTFMDAYLLVDTNTRRSMEGMLRTWKEPVPNSLDPRPVFPPETVNPIENALMKAKAFTGTRQPPAGMQFQNAPTPPQYNTQFVPPHLPHQQQFNGYAGHQATPQHNPQPYQPPTPLQHAELPNPYGTPQSGHEIEAVKTDVANLVSRMRAQFAANPHDQSVGAKLPSLLQLQILLNDRSRTITPTEIQQIKAQISVLSATPNSTPQWQPPLPQHIPPPPAGYVPPTTYLQPPVPTPQAQPQPSTSLDPAVLQSLQAILAGGQKPSTPQMRSAVPALQGASHTQLQNVQNQVQTAPQISTNDLMAALSKNNLMPPPAVSTPVQAPSIPAVAPSTNAASTSALLASISSFLPRPQSNAPTVSSTATGKPYMPMNPAALKIFRPELVRSLYDAQPNQCNNCGRRFLADEDGRLKKSRHLDWHFRTNQRMADSNTNRGHHRNWFVDEMEWIRLTEFDPSTTTAEDASQLAAKKKEKNVQDQYLRAPPGMTKNTCSICYEDMKSSYSDDLQDWVFTNAVQYAQGKIVHATCAEEIKKSMPLPAANTATTSSLAAALSSLSGARSRSATPDSSLGKRKAENTLPSVGAQRVRIE